MIRAALLVAITTLAAAVTFLLNAIWLGDGRWAWTGVVATLLLIVELVILSIIADGEIR